LKYKKAVKITPALLNDVPLQQCYLSQEVKFRYIVVSQTPIVV